MKKFTGYAYRIEVTDREGNWYQLGFPFSATQKNLKLWVDTYNQSILYGNHQHLGHGALIASAKLISMKNPSRKKTVLEATVKYEE